MDTLLNTIKGYLPDNRIQRQNKSALLQDLQTHGEGLLFRSSEIHLTASAMVLNPALSNVLMAHHNIYDSYGWLGGHVDGDADILAVAKRELEEETALKTFYPITTRILSIDVLPVKGHEHKGEWVAAHTHYTVTYGFIAPDGQRVVHKPDENSAVAWVPVDDIEAVCGEPHMIPIYRYLIEKMQVLKAEKKNTLKILPGALLPWYQKYARALPWRRDREPYHVWLSEIMLQQTRVEAVMPYYKRFLEALPTIQDLAAVDEQALLKLWEGLGYYSRARNLKKAAEVVVKDLGGEFPASYEDILKLPGIGPYTAGAIASICFNEPVAAVDGNVLRVVSRAFELYAPIDLQYTKNLVAAELGEIYPQKAPGDFTQAIMELGATVCLPNGAPLCDRCPLKKHCLAYAHGTIDTLPVRLPKRKRKIEVRTVFLFIWDEEVALLKREESGLLAGFWEFPNTLGELSVEEALVQVEAWGAKPMRVESEVRRKHIFTHVEWHMKGYVIHLEERAAAFRWASMEQLIEEVPLPTAFKQFTDVLFNMKN